jgi:hypothetical protein
MEQVKAAGVTKSVGRVRKVGEEKEEREEQ